jgi:hypothetical protein
MGAHYVLMERETKHDPNGVTLRALRTNQRECKPVHFVSLLSQLSE